MFNKILVGAGLFTGIILLIENIIASAQSKLFVIIWEVSGPSLVLFCIIVGIVIGYGIKGIMSDDSGYESESDF